MKSGLCMKVFIIYCLLGTGVLSSVDAQVLWDFKVGASYHNVCDERKLDYMGELGIDIPIKEKFSLEAGLRYKNILFVDDLDNVDYDTYKPYAADGEDIRANILELPVKFGYKLRLAENSNLRFGVGPYVSAGMNGSMKLFGAGVTSCVVYEYKKVNVGLNYNITCHEPYKNMAKEGVFLTIGVKFGNSVWRGIGTGLAAVGSVAGSVADAYTESTGSSFVNDNVDNTGSGYSVSNNTNGSASGSTSRSSSNNSVSDVQAKNTDSNTYSKDESLLVKMNTYYERDYNDSDRISIQSRMKSIRTKWEGRGFKMRHSQWEDWDGRKK
ncbi:outer membrane beta-barrel protein [Bacteroides helcogenes]|uniref:Outer membrane protein beta-barrel domain-containing protein n=1 Tax=Bacteroides helcogenes (strain ATCC 35417 / DSM 20613 / JCM 6297 / CCUG 15421 / P 36-108) TaxID=693979 RepID=E6SNZ5_BACT6|nr:outer membrane beta-barrel protein [Bacteroides helcogenes]ADV42813.1 hypothetical protein Bache_0792 [Bacteroides helcogenes P 36-108]MDY5239643.1 outer membrane beta-barrel protein [Bacteroides helcogenes]